MLYCWCGRATQQRWACTPQASDFWGEICQMFSKYSVFVFVFILVFVSLNLDLSCLLLRSRSTPQVSDFYKGEIRQTTAHPGRSWVGQTYIASHGQCSDFSYLPVGVWLTQRVSIDVEYMMTKEKPQSRRITPLHCSDRELPTSWPNPRNSLRNVIHSGSQLVAE